MISPMNAHSRLSAHYAWELNVHAHKLLFVYIGIEHYWARGIVRLCSPHQSIVRSIVQYYNSLNKYFHVFYGKYLDIITQWMYWYDTWCLHQYYHGCMLATLGCTLVTSSWMLVAFCCSIYRILYTKHCPWWSSTTPLWWRLSIYLHARSTINLCMYYFMLVILRVS